MFKIITDSKYDTVYNNNDGWFLLNFFFEERTIYIYVLR